MQITQTQSEGLKREFRVVIGAAAIQSAADEKLKALAERAQMPGFRPGKAPVALLKKQYGRAVLGEVLEEQVNAGLAKTLEDHQLKPAMQPKVDVKKFDEGTDLEYTMEMEVLPEIEPGDFKSISLERLVADIPEGDVDSALQRMADQQKEFETIVEARAAAKGDAVVIDFVGKVSDVAFEGGTAENFTLQLGSGMFIPGFEDQLVGAKAGDKVAVSVTFPEAYANKELAGKPAVFDVTVKELKAPKTVVIDDEFAKRMGLDTLAALKDAVRKQMEQEYAGVARMRVKRKLLDALAAAHSFDVPAGMVGLEFEQIWQNYMSESPEAVAERAKQTKSEDELKAEYRGIAERRVRLGLLLAEVGRRNNIEVKQEEIGRAIVEQARRFPGQEKQVFDFFRKNEAAANQLRAPIFEDKVVDFILELAKVDEKKVPPAELMADPDEAAA